MTLARQMAKPTLSRKCHSAGDLCDRFAAKSRDSVRRQRMIEAVGAGCGRALAALQNAGRQVAGAGRDVAQRLRRMAAETQSPLDPLLDANAARAAGHQHARVLGRPHRRQPVGRVGAGDLPDPDQSDAGRPARGGRLRRPVRQPAAGDRDGGRHRGARRGVVARLGEEGRRRTPACAHRRPLQRHRGAAGPAAGGRRHHHLLARPRQLVQPADHVDRAQLAQRGARLPGRARPGDPHRHRQHGQGPRRRRAAGCGRPAQVSRADVRPGGPARPSRHLRRGLQGCREGGRAGGRQDPLHRPARAPDPRRRRRPGAPVDAQRQLPRRRPGQAAQLSGFLSLRRPRRRPRGRQASAADGSRRQALREPAGRCAAA